jgi:hypothetical protein
MTEAKTQPNYATPGVKLSPAAAPPPFSVGKDKTDNKSQILNTAAHKNPA